MVSCVRNRHEGVRAAAAQNDFGFVMAMLDMASKNIPHATPPRAGPGRNGRIKKVTMSIGAGL